MTAIIPWPMFNELTHAAGTVILFVGIFAILGIAFDILILWMADL